jgi:hypothetical protein
MDEHGARLDTPICSVHVVMDPYDQYENIRSSCAFTFENNCLRNCEGIALGISDMNAAGDCEYRSEGGFFLMFFLQSA